MVKFKIKDAVEAEEVVEWNLEINAYGTLLLKGNGEILLAIDSEDVKIYKSAAFNGGRIPGIEYDEKGDPVVV